jgi:hypothetical protein
MNFVGALAMLALLVWCSTNGLAQTKTDCKFLNENCDGSASETRTRADPNLSDAEHLQRCLADYERRNGAFVPEGRSTAFAKSHSDMTAMCMQAIKVKNYFWSYPANPDVEANMRCCLKMGVDKKTCEDNLVGAARAKLNMDFCYFASRGGEPPPKDWNVPAGCTSGPCLITPGYCKSVGYAEMSRATVPAAVASMRAQIAKYPSSAESFRAVLRVCFGVR